MGFDWELKISQHFNRQLRNWWNDLLLIFIQPNSKVQKLTDGWNIAEGLIDD